MPYNIQDPFAFIIFGASGDLARIKIFPAMYSLMEQGRFPKEFYIIGFARSKKTRKEFQKEFEESVREKMKNKIDEKILKNLLDKIYYFEGQYSEIESYKKLKTFLNEITQNKTVTKIAYFSVPPTVFKDIIENIGKTKTNKNEDFRLVLEKPFGEDTRSAEELFHFTARYFKEESIYLLDHYLGKSAVQSILHLRHGNKVLNLLINGQEIANIQISAFEDIGVKERAGYFDQVGTLKDMVQSHLLQVLALLTMPIPIILSEQSIHREKYNILSSLMWPRSSRNIVIGQYRSYKKEKDVPKHSKTETFAALRLFIDQENWYKVPIYIRTGKNLDKKHTFIAIEMKKFAFQSKDEEPNRVILELQPQEKIIIKLLNRHGVTAKYQEIQTSESIAYIGEDALPEHAILLLDVIRGRKIRFLSFPEIIATWKLTDKIINFAKEGKNAQVEIYEDKSEGPISQNKLTEIDGFKWFDNN